MPNTRTHGAYILARYSTDRQNADSIEVQVQKCAEWCEKNYIPVLGIFADMAVSGMKDTRPEYARMMTQLSAGGADTVVIYDQSRMFRKMTAWFDFRAALEKMGVSVVSVTQPMIGGDLRDPANFLTEGSTALFNQMWALQTRQKVIEKMRFMAQNGQHTGGKPALGYMIVNGKLQICEAEAVIVREVFAAYASGKAYREIIADLNAKGRRTKNGNHFGVNSLHDMLKNEKYIGVLTYGKVKKKPDGRRNSHGMAAADVIRLEDAIPAIVDKNTWDTVQAKMAKNKRQAGGRPPMRDYPLKGKVFCGKCKHAMAVTKSKGKYYYYACAYKQRTGQCDLMPISVPELERIVIDAVRELLGDKPNMEKLLVVLRDEREKLHGGAADELQRLINTRSDIVRKLDAATDAVLSGLHSATLAKKVETLEHDLTNVERQISDLKKAVDGSNIVESELRKLLETVIETGMSAESLLTIVRRVEVDDENITIWTITDRGVPDDESGYKVIISHGDRSPAPSIFITASSVIIRAKRKNAT